MHTLPQCNARCDQCRDWHELCAGAAQLDLEQNLSVPLRLVVATLLALMALYVGYALAAGYVGALPTPLNLVAGLAVLAAAGVGGARLLARSNAA